MIGKIPNSPNFCSLKISTDSHTKEAVHKYANNMSRIRTLSDTFKKIDEQTGKHDVIIAGKYRAAGTVPDCSKDYVELQAFCFESEPLAKVVLPVGEKEIKTKKITKFANKIIKAVNKLDQSEKK